MALATIAAPEAEVSVIAAEAAEMEGIALLSALAEQAEIEAGAAQIAATAPSEEALAFGPSQVAPTIATEETGIQWGQGIQNQGLPWERTIALQLPEDVIATSEISSNFKTIDHWVKSTGSAISDKTIDITAKTYANNPSKITSIINKYTKQLSNFKEYLAPNKIDLQIQAEDIKQRVVELAVRSDGSSELWSKDVWIALGRAEETAKI